MAEIEKCERNDAFNRLTGQMGKEASLVKMVLALWLSLETAAGYINLMKLALDNEDNAIETLFNETLLCLECIKPDATEPEDLNDLPSLDSLVNKPINCRLLYNQRKSIYENYSYYLKTTFAVAIDAEADESEIQSGAIEQGESSTQGNETGMRSSTLNPYAREFNPEEIPEEARTLYLTFSSGNPLTEQEIFDFFNMCLGSVNMVENVFIEHPPDGILPLCGSVRFTTSLAIPIILNGHIVAKYMVNGKHLWARRYNPSQRRNAFYQAGSSSSSNNN